MDYGCSRLLAVLSCLCALAACQQQTPALQPQAPAALPAVQAVDAGAEAVALKDTIETDPRFIVGISYPPAVNRYPGLAAELRRYSNAARNDLMEAVSGLGGEAPTSPYDLALATPCWRRIGSPKPPSPFKIHLQPRRRMPSEAVRRHVASPCAA